MRKSRSNIIPAFNRNFAARLERRDRHGLCQNRGTAAAGNQNSKTGSRSGSPPGVGFDCAHVQKTGPKYRWIGSHDADNRGGVPPSRGSEAGVSGQILCRKNSSFSGPCASVPLRHPRFPGFLQGDSFVITDKPELADDSSIYAHAFRYAVLFINKKNQAAGFSNQAFVAPVALPLPPPGISAKVTEDAIRLSWTAPSENIDGSRPPRVAGYDLYRSGDSAETALRAG